MAVALKQVLSDPECIDFIPFSWLEEKQKKSREYLWNLLSSLQPDYVQMVCSYANKQRQKELDDQGQQV